jgi:hypothetical protein
MEIFENGYLLTLVIVLSLISTVFCMMGFKRKDMPFILIGIGTGVPTFDVLDYRMWIAGIGLCLVGLWLRNKLQSV